LLNESLSLTKFDLSPIGKQQRFLYQKLQVIEGFG